MNKIGDIAEYASRNRGVTTMEPLPPLPIGQRPMTNRERFELENAEWERKAREKRKAETHDLPDPIPPTLPDGHTLVYTDPDEARYRDCWKAVGLDGNEYRVGCSKRENRAGFTHYVHTDAWGRVVERWEGPNGTAGTGAPPTYADTRRKEVPARFDTDPWTLRNGATVGGKDVQVLQGWVKALKAKQSSSLWMTGRPGRGKTQLAWWTLLALAEVEVEALFVSVPDLVADMRETYNAERDARQKWDRLVARYCECDVLILDDIGAESRGDDVRTVLYRIIDARWQDEAPTLCTSNATIEQLAEGGMDGRLVSRLSSYHVLRIDGPDYRVRKP